MSSVMACSAALVTCTREGPSGELLLAICNVKEKVQKVNIGHHILCSFRQNLQFLWALCSVTATESMPRVMGRCSAEARRVHSPLSYGRFIPLGVSALHQSPLTSTPKAAATQGDGHGHTLEATLVRSREYSRSSASVAEVLPLLISLRMAIRAPHALEGLPRPRRRRRAHLTDSPMETWGNPKRCLHKHGVEEKRSVPEWEQE